jgi:hypothetical protein
MIRHQRDLANRWRDDPLAVPTWETIIRPRRQGIPCQRGRTASGT